MCDIYVVKELRKLRKRVEEIMSKITDFATTVQAQFDTLNASLDNIVSDEANLAKQITDLQAQIAAGNSTLNPLDQAALDSVVTNATAAAAKTAGVAAAVPDLPLPPTTA
jgi:predicted  nucleic acid-binding Zn-ribbon protein